MDRIIHRALAKQPESRYPSAGAMAEALRHVLDTTSDTAAHTQARPVSRMIVLPFQMLRPDADIEFLAFSLPDAITSSLSGLPSLVVRSSRAAGKFDSAAPDLRALAERTEVDLALVGTLLRAGDRLRVKAQLLEVPSGTVLWSHAAQVTLQDLFQLEDDLTQRIVESLSEPLTTDEQERLGHDTPASATAYELYLRANQLGQDPEQWEIARSLYQQCVDSDPDYAPAWARLGRMHRVLTKFSVMDQPDRYAEGLARAESAFTRALTLNPALTIAHNLHASLEVERGCAKDAMVRLLQRGHTHGADPELFAGLVVACRYCGLLEASYAAHEQARRLDPGIPTSVSFTLWAGGDYDAAARCATATDFSVRMQCLMLSGRHAEAIEALSRSESSGGTRSARLPRLVVSLLRVVATGKGGQELEALGTEFDTLLAVDWDPEGTFRIGLYFAQAGDPERALALIDSGITRGFVCHPVMLRDPWCDPVRDHPEFRRLLAVAENRHQAAAAAFAEAGGHRVLGTLPAN